MRTPAAAVCRGRWHSCRAPGREYKPTRTHAQVQVVRPPSFESLSKEDAQAEALEELPQEGLGAAAYEPGTAYVYLLRK